MKTIGQELKLRRLHAGFTLQQVADATGASRGHIHDIEKGRSKRPSFKIIVAISKTLSVRLDVLASYV